MFPSDLKAYQGKKVIVTGAGGFIGTQLCNKLLALGAQVTGIDLPGVQMTVQHPDFYSVACDFEETKEYLDQLLDSQFVFHLAARTDLDGKSIDDYGVNFQGTEKLLNALASSRKLECFVFYSTQLVTGIFSEERFVEETEPFFTQTLYGESKILAEQVVMRGCAEKKIPWVIIRPTSVYGPGCKVPYRNFFLSIKRGQYFHIGRANNFVSMCYVGNLVDQTVYLAACPQANGRVFYGSDLFPYTMRQFASTAAEILGRKLPTIPGFVVIPAVYLLGLLKLIGLNPPIYPRRLKNLQATYCYAIRGALELGFVPRIGLQQGMEETLNWFNENDPDFR